MKAIVIILAMALVAQGALAQPPDDTTDVDETTSAIEAAPLNPAEAAKVVADAKTYVNDKAVRPDGERTETDRSYEQKVLGAFRAAQGSQGQLDGRWMVSGSDGVALYSLQLTDPGAGEARIEGAWRNLKLNGLGASGFVETVRREADDVVFTFRDGPTEVATEIRLRLSPSGMWVGEAQTQTGRLGIIANRGQGLETASMAVPEWRAPPPPPPRAKAKAKVKSKSKARPKSKNRRLRR